MSRTIIDYLEKQKDNSCTAYIDGDTEVSFRDILGKAKVIAANLSAYLNPGEPAAILSGRHTGTIAGYLGIVYAGCYYAPIDGEMPVSRISKILSLLSPSVLITDAEFRKTAEECGYSGKLLSLEELSEGTADEEVIRARTVHYDGSDPLYVLFTSGSSGVPKGVLTGQESVMNYIDAVCEVLDVKEDDVLGNQAPLDYIAAIRDIYIPFLTGCKTVILPKKEFAMPSLLFRTLIRNGVTILCWSAAGLETLARLKAFDCKPEDLPVQLKTILFSGSVMPGKILRQYQEHLPRTRFINQYGPTEATASCTYYEVDHIVAEDEVLPIGVPYRNYTIFLRKEDGSEAEPGETAEICVGGPGVTIGYYKDPERTALSYIADPRDPGKRLYRTGDYGRYREDGLLEFHGRMDRQVKHFGHRIELDEIEGAAGRIDGVEGCYAYYDREKEVLCLAYAGTALKSDIAKAFRKDFPAFMVPRKVTQLEEIPKLPNGKTDMSKLREILKGQ